jgi:hypothetical protein
LPGGVVAQAFPASGVPQAVQRGHQGGQVAVKGRDRAVAGAVAAQGLLVGLVVGVAQGADRLV